MNLISHLDKNNLHHAYLIEGARDEIVPAIFKFLENSGISTVGNSDCVRINLNSFRIEDARNLKSYGSQKSFSAAKKVFIISANNFLLEAQNSLLKMFEEPIENTHFFLVVPDKNALLKTLVSRFYLISPTPGVGEEVEKAEKFIKLSARDRIEFLKEFLAESNEEELVEDSVHSKSLKFLNSLESFLHSHMSKRHFDTNYFEQIFKVRKFLRMPGSSAKSLMESVALITPDFSN